MGNNNKDSAATSIESGSLVRNANVPSTPVFRMVQNGACSAEGFPLETLTGDQNGHKMGTAGGKMPCGRRIDLTPEKFRWINRRGGAICFYRRGPTWWFDFSVRGSRRRASTFSTEADDAVRVAYDMHGREIRSLGKPPMAKAKSTQYRRPGCLSYGHIYFVQCHATGHVKIGWATNVPNRLAALRTASSTKLELLRSVRGRLEDERALHAEFESERAHGEWFVGSERLLSRVKTIEDFPFENAFIRWGVEHATAEQVDPEARHD